LVIQQCLARGISVVAGHAPDGPRVRRTESSWRTARWAFLRAVADERRATIATAHTLDDQAETVAIRILRGASARGLAGMAVSTLGIVRPFLGIRRADVAAYALARGVACRVDPSNTDRAFLRNRIRADLLTAIEVHHPDFGDLLIDIGRRAAAWRAQLSALVDRLGPQRLDAAVVLDAVSLTSLTPEGLAIVWPELAARAGVVMDRRGIIRAAEWALSASPGQRMPLSGGAVVERTARTFVLRPAGASNEGKRR
jgi:tRNA(Ile)-lysidine synthase